MKLLDYVNTKAGRYLLGERSGYPIVRTTSNSYHMLVDRIKGKPIIQASFFTYNRLDELFGIPLTRMDIAEAEGYEAFLHYTNLEQKRNKYPQVYLDTFNPGAGSDSSINVTDASWATVHGALTGTNNTDSGVCLAALSGNYNCYRMGNCFNTASLPDGDTILSATIRLFHLAANFGNADTTTYEVVAFTPADPASIAAGDYDQFGTTVFAEKNLADITQGAYNTYTLSAGGIANISKTGYSNFGYRIGRDVDNSAPTGVNRVDSTPRTGGNPEVLTVVLPVSAGAGHAYFM